MNGPPKSMPTFKNALPALSLFAGKFPMSCSPDLALKRKQVWHLDKSLPTTPLPEGIRISVECRGKLRSTVQIDMMKMLNDQISEVMALRKENWVF
ncbi:hypothetical protein TNCV_2227081 [Trichonephila clavipes]|uniref:Uncharacterized protein n=1 Tax=Trichonephila clavipes TaxID=2585209 RepID=A0A8X7BKB6_TRICX|nr:hypothetical protein TNCV_2227081 [Trichonephila clavipes]